MFIKLSDLREHCSINCRIRSYTFQVNLIFQMSVQLGLVAAFDELTRNARVLSVGIERGKNLMLQNLHIF